VEERTILDTLYGIRSHVQSEIDAVIRATGKDDVVWKGTANMEQRCYRCGLWISHGEVIAAVRLLDRDDTIVQRYIHERCVNA
jgi:hypothetical protein